MGFIITLVLIGLALILAEIILVPGFGIAGLLGVASLGGACCYAFYEFGSTIGYIVTAANLVLLIVFTIYVLRAKTWKRFTLNTNIDSKAVGSGDLPVIGDRGKTTTRLSPVGMVRIGQHIVEAKALEGMIDPGVEVVVVLIEDNKIYVSPVSEL